MNHDDLPSTGPVYRVAFFTEVNPDTLGEPYFRIDRDGEHHDPGECVAIVDAEGDLVAMVPKERAGQLLSLLQDLAVYSGTYWYDDDAEIHNARPTSRGQEPE